MAYSKTVRASLAAACLAGSALVPAVTQAQTQDREIGDVAEELSDPVNQLAVTAALVAMSEALLDIDMAPFVRMADAVGADSPLRDLPPDARLRDVAGPEGDRMQRQLARRTPEMMGAVAGMVGALEDMMPQLRGMAERMKDAMPR